VKDHFEIRLDFKPNTGSPERVFLAMAEYVSAFEKLVYVVGQGIDPESEVSCELSAVEIGSLKSIVDCIGNYGSILSRVPSMIAGHMIDVGEIDREEQIEDFVSNIEADVLADTNLDFPNQANINRLEFAKGLMQLTEASKKLVDGETVDVRNNNDNVIYINTKTRFSRDPGDIFKEHFELKREKETLLIKTPVFVGNSMWGFKSIQRKKAFSAPIEDKDWLEKYQNREVYLEPGDAISAIVEYVIYKEKGAKYYGFKDHKILDVGRPIKNEELQHILELETKNEEQ
jgi:hypothetical protein